MTNAPGIRRTAPTPERPAGWLARAFKGLCGVFKRPLVPAANERSEVAGIGAVNAIATGDNWILIAPFGEHPNVVGNQVFDQEAANAVVAHHRSLLGRVGRLFKGLPIYVGHPDYAPNAHEYPDKTVYGQLTELAVRADGLYGRAEWTAEGKAMVNEGQFRFQSPHWGMTPIKNWKLAPESYRPVQLYSIGLTNQPNLPVPPLPAQNEARTQPEDTMNKKKLVELLKLQPAANTAEVTDAQIEAAVEALLGQHAAANAKATTLEANLTAANDRATQAEAAVTAANSRATQAEAARNEQLVTAAVNEGRITGADRAGWLGKLAGDFAANSKALGELKPTLKTESQAQQLGGRRQESAQVDPVIAINEAVTAHMHTTGEKDYARAFAAVKAKQPQLFAAPAAA